MSITKDIKDLSTPALLVDLNVMEGNLHRMSAFFKNKPCGLRPHFKNTKCVALAEMQLATGAIGITSATVGETETLAKAGIKSILVANEIAGDANLKRLIELCALSNIILAVDNEAVVKDIARLVAKKKHKPSLVVDIDLGLKRCGVLPGHAAFELTKRILEYDLPFEGIMGYEGHLQRLKDENATLTIRKEAFSQLIGTKNLLQRNGIAVKIVSTGGTGTAAIAGKVDGITEVQPGNYLLMDTSYAPFAPDFQPALSLLTTVISVTPSERFVLNAGIKEISAERGLPTLKSLKGAELKALHAEHGIVEIQSDSLKIKVGDPLELDVYYSDGTVNLHRFMYGVRNGKVETTFSIAS